MVCNSMLKKTSYHHGDLAAALITQGLVQVETDGVEDLGIKSVANAVGVSHAAVYRHFDDRRDFLQALSCRGFELLRADMARAVSRQRAQPREQLLAVGYSVVRFARKRPQLYRLMFSGFFPTSIPELEGAPGESAFGYVLDQVTSWQRAGVLGPGAPVDLAMSLWITTHGLNQLLLTGQLQLPARRLKALADSVHQRMLAGLQPVDKQGQ